MGLFEQMGLQYGDAPEETEEVSQDDYRRRKQRTVGEKLWKIRSDNR